MSNTAHEGMDDMGSYLDAHPCIKRRESHRALPLPADWPQRRAFVPQGCDQQGRLTPSIKPADPFPVVADRMPEVFDDQSDSADGEVMGLLVKGVAVVLLACLCVWAIANYLELARVS